MTCARRLPSVVRSRRCGQLRPSGAGQLVLPFDQAALPAGFGAPYELRDLQLQDQSRMAPIESRALALRF